MQPSFDRDRARRGWDAEALRAPHAQPDKAARVEAMFDAIAPSYERVNTLSTLGRDAIWRRRAVATAGVRPGDVVLDVCCGTGDMMRLFGCTPPQPRMIVGVDFAAEMLAAGTFDCGSAPAHVLRADALRLPLGDETVDVVSCAFGVRNFVDLQAGLNELGRVMRPGGRLVILEFATPERPLLRRAYQLYCDVVLPWLGTWISRDRTGAYQYLPRSIETFETARSMQERLTRTGFENVEVQRFNLGGVALYRGVRRATRFRQ